MSDTTPSRPRIDVALVHHPVLGRDGSEITTSLTPMDLHDISRTCKTYQVECYYVVHPHKTMQTIAQRVRDYWDSGTGKAYEHNRARAFKLLELVSSIDEALFDAKARRGQRPLVVATSARSYDAKTSGYKEVRERIEGSDQAAMLLFGTGWGLLPETLEKADVLLPPIRPGAAFNHLSVRSAVAITLDRLLGDDHIERGDSDD